MCVSTRIETLGDAWIVGRCERSDQGRCSSFQCFQWLLSERDVYVLHSFVWRVILIAIANCNNKCLLVARKRSTWTGCLHCKRVKVSAVKWRDSLPDQFPLALSFVPPQADRFERGRRPLFSLKSQEFLYCRHWNQNDDQNHFFSPERSSFAHHDLRQADRQKQRSQGFLTFLLLFC